MMAADWPRLFVVGAEKAGTTTLDAWLRAHPDICMPRVKEPSFFARAAWPPSREAKQEYLDLFKAPGVRGDASPIHLHHPAAAKRIHGLAPDASILVLVREPVARAHSAYLHACRTQRLPPFEQFVDEAERQGPQGVRFMDRSLYAGAVRRYQALFPTTKVLETATMARDPESAWASICQWAGVAHIPLDPAFLRVRRNVQRRPRNRLGRRLLVDQRLAAMAKAVLPVRLLMPLADRLLWDPTTPQLAPATRKRAARLYADDIAALQDLTGSRLSSLQTDD